MGTISFLIIVAQSRKVWVIPKYVYMGIIYRYKRVHYKELSQDIFSDPQTCYGYHIDANGFQPILCADVTMPQ